MKLIVITRPEFFTVEHHLINALFNEGLDILHLRKPQGRQELFERLLSLLPESYRKRIVIHDNFDLKKKYGLMGVHVSGHSSEYSSLHRGTVSCTCHGIAELRANRNGMSYMMLSPVFRKDNINEFNDAFTPSQLRAASDKGIIDNKVMAAGSVGVDNVAKLRGFGFGGVTLCEELIKRFDPVGSTDFREEINYFRLVRRTTE